MREVHLPASRFRDARREADLVDARQHPSTGTVSYLGSEGGGVPGNLHSRGQRHRLLIRCVLEGKVPPPVNNGWHWHTPWGEVRPRPALRFPAKRWRRDVIGGLKHAGRMRTERASGHDGDAASASASWRVLWITDGAIENIMCTRFNVT